MKGSHRIRINLVLPESPVRRTGNRCTAAQWAEMFASLGHEVVIGEDGIESPCKVLVALHGTRSHDAIQRFRHLRPDGKVVVALTGSDIYPAPGDEVKESIEWADRVVVLQRKALDQIPATHRSKARLIIQSAEAIGESSAADDSVFPVCVVGHLRDVKDPLRAARASRLLPDDSRIHIRHAGGILEPKYRELVEQEARENHRYEWLGELDEKAVANLIASSRLLVMPSLFEGGGRAVGEATVHKTPVIASRVDGLVGLLGDDYPGYFPVGDTQSLADLLQRAESDSDFFDSLKHKATELAPQFQPRRERQAWESMLDELCK